MSFLEKEMTRYFEIQSQTKSHLLKEKKRKKCISTLQGHPIRYIKTFKHMHDKDAYKVVNLPKA